MAYRLYEYDLFRVLHIYFFLITGGARLELRCHGYGSFISDYIYDGQYMWDRWYIY